MIEINEIFSDSDKRVALWCEKAIDTNELALLCENIISNGIDLISVPPEVTPMVWAYLEKRDVKILTRYDFKPLQKNIDQDMYELSANIMNSCKHGADGVQIFVQMRDFERFVDLLKIVRDDLFFEKDLCLAMDIQDLDMSNIGDMFKKLRDVRAGCLTLTLNEDMGNRSDFVGRVYGLLQNWDFDGELHFILGNNFDRIDQVIRLCECLKPEISEKLRFFLDY